MKTIYNSSKFFIKGIKPLENSLKKEIVNNFIKSGISNGFENLSTRFNEEHISLINEINSGINNILKDENDGKNGIKGNNSEIENKIHFVSDTNNPFWILMNLRMKKILKKLRIIMEIIQIIKIFLYLIRKIIVLIFIHIFF